MLLEKLFSTTSNTQIILPLYQHTTKHISINPNYRPDVLDIVLVSVLLFTQIHNLNELLSNQNAIQLEILNIFLFASFPASFRLINCKNYNKIFSNISAIFNLNTNDKHYTDFATENFTSVFTLTRKNASNTISSVIELEITEKNRLCRE